MAGGANDVREARWRGRCHGAHRTNQPPGRTKRRSFAGVKELPDALHHLPARVEDGGLLIFLQIDANAGCRQ